MQKAKRKPRIIRNPIAHAILRASRLTAAEVSQIITPTSDALRDFREGTATHDAFGHIVSALYVAKAIEGTNARIVKGFAEIINHAQNALEKIEQRAMVNNQWSPPTLYSVELAALTDLVRIHKFQLEILSAGEFYSVIDKVIKNGKL